MIDCNAAIASLDWSREPQGLYAPIAYALSSGGKRLRMQLALAACRLFGGNEQDALPYAQAIEVFHNFTLLHDDVMDRADVRRGMPTVHVKWNELNVIGVTEGIYNDTVAISKASPYSTPELVEALQNCFINIINTEEGKAIFDVYSHTGYAKAVDSDYDGARLAQSLLSE